MGKNGRFPGVSEEVQKLVDADMDFVDSRRRAREAFKQIQLSVDHVLFKTPSEGLKMEESYEVNSRGLEIFCKSWLPETPKAVICFCHGYGDTCTFFFEGVARKLANAGYGVFAMDYPGFGLSEGLHGYVPDFDKLVDDVIEHYSKIKENPELHGLPSFLYGESMGGAVALKVHLKQPDSWSGAILSAPMCKIDQDLVPPWLLTQVLIGVAKFLPKQKLVPLNNLGDLAFREANKRKQAAYNIIAYRHKPRLRTALELLKTTKEIEESLEKKWWSDLQVSLPLLILHGKKDLLTDPSVSEALYEKASSRDKKLNLYQESYHCLLEGEPDEMIQKVFEDMISWLDEHTKAR
ncbi:hypothetical protein DM860_015945 [Cuscuta australis]|uniref:Serine aminopeptidase S33 domain-containing protein n=1 Tax=Cuscuta australis TaxID=267555 RepID=A0A328E207_9ASTE|nr:hypothetical protein DM860_015945 [Cuscuta australis]